MVQLELEFLQRAASITNSSGYSEHISNAMSRIRDAREDLFQLLEETTQQGAPFDVIPVLNDVINSFEPLARHQNCTIAKIGKWPTEVCVWGNVYEVKRALNCLADNAIKYSFRGQRHDFSGLYEVRIKVMAADNYVRITLVNYGVGFPQEIFERIRDYTIRGKVQDTKKDRPGFGLGLPYAIEVFEKLGGWIEITSVPSKSASEEEIQNYLRYITTVEAALPVITRG